jgi:putative tricarboxylic transport membrane protein
MSGATARSVDKAGIVIAAVLALVAGVIIWDAAHLASNNVYGMGPAAAPYVVAIGLLILSVGNLIGGLRGDLPPREEADPRAVFLILGGLAVMIALIGLGGGFILAETALFTATSAAFGRRAFLKDAAIGFIGGTLIFLAFDKLLTLSLSAGPLERLF